MNFGYLQVMHFNETWYPEHPTGVNTVPFMRKVLDIISMYNISSFFEKEDILGVVKKDGLHEFVSGTSVLKFETKRSTPQQFIIEFRSDDFSFRYQYELSAQFTNGTHTLTVDEQDGESAIGALKGLVEESIQESHDFLLKKGAIQAKVKDGKLIIPEKKAPKTEENPRTDQYNFHGYYLQSTNCTISKSTGNNQVSWVAEGKDKRLRILIKKDSVFWGETTGTRNIGSAQGGYSGDLSIQEFVDGIDEIHQLVRSYFGDTFLNQMLDIAKVYQLIYSKKNQAKPKPKEIKPTQEIRRSAGETFLRYEMLRNGDSYDLIADVVEVRYGVTTSVSSIGSAQGGFGEEATHQEFLDGKGHDFIRSWFGEKILAELIHFVENFGVSPN